MNEPDAVSCELFQPPLAGEPGNRAAEVSDLSATDQLHHDILFSSRKENHIFVSSRKSTPSPVELVVPNSVTIKATPLLSAVWALSLRDCLWVPG